VLPPAWCSVLCCPRVSAAARGSTSDEPEPTTKSPGVPSAIDYQHSVLVCDRVDNRHDARIRVVYQRTSIQRLLCFAPLTPELTTYLCSTAPTLLYHSCLRTYMHIHTYMVPVFMRSAGILININTCIHACMHSCMCASARACLAHSTSLRI
jgi:hypothetical protein